MKWIQKNQKNEPDDFRTYRETTPGARYNGGNFSVPGLKQRLLEEQGWICVYCMGKLDTVESAHIEHYCPQEACSEKDLDYMNLFAVCKGQTDSHPEKESFYHCDKTQGKDGKMNGAVKLVKLNPADPNCENQVTYNLNGHILPRNNDQQVGYELNTVLNLNNKALIQRRKSAQDRAKELLEGGQSSDLWKRKFLERHRQDWLDLHCRKGKQIFRPYCLAAAWFIDELLKKPKYQ